MKRALIGTVLVVGGVFLGTVCGGLLVRLVEVFMRENAGSLAYSMTMILSAGGGCILGLMAASEVRP